MLQTKVCKSLTAEGIKRIADFREVETKPNVLSFLIKFYMELIQSEVCRPVSAERFGVFEEQRNDSYQKAISSKQLEQEQDCI